MPTSILDRPADSDHELAGLVAELTRRGFLGGLGGSAALLGLAACGSSASPGPTATPAGKRAVSTIHGEIDVPAEPTRIVALDFPEGCALLDLGITPVGRPNYMPDFPAYNTALQGVAKVTDADGKPLMEQVAALKPDLIVTADWADPKQQQMPYVQLNAIAPTAVFVWEQSAGNWQAQAAATAGAVNKKAALAALKSKYVAQAASIKKTYASLLANNTWDVIDCSQNVWDLYGPAASHTGVLTTAGVRLAAAKTQTTGYKEYSFERFDLLEDTDIILTTNASLPYLKKQPAFTNLPAVKAGHLYSTDLFFPASYGIAAGLLEDLAAVCQKVGAA